MSKKAFPGILLSAILLGTMGQCVAETPAETTSQSRPSHEQQFITRVARINLAAMMIGRQATQKSNNSQVKTVGIKLASNHETALAALTPIAQTLGMTLPGEANQKQQAEYKELSILSGTAYDVTFVKHMKAAHIEAIKFFKAETEQTTLPELKAYCLKYLPKLKSILAALNQVTPLQP